MEMDIKPWEWDWENYTGENADMIGFFYPEDIANIEQIAHYKSEYLRRHHK
jgi:hypothetical protein